MSPAQSHATIPLLRVERVSRAFEVRRGLRRKSRVRFQAVDDVSFDLWPGETLGIVGESGCGKSTLSQLIVKLLAMTRGRIYYKGKAINELRKADLAAFRRQVQLIFQDPYSSLNPRMSIGATVGEPLLIHGLAPRQEISTRVAQLLDRVGLSSDYARRYPHELSGGQRQRVGIARALAVEPDLIVCDEPVSALDVSIQAQIINLLMQLQRDLGLTYIFIAHDLSVVKHIADRVAVMYLGKIVELADSDRVFSRPRHPYTQALLAAVPKAEPGRHKQRAILDEDLPSALEAPEGCRFHTRCPHAQHRCGHDEPLLQGTEHQVACHYSETVAENYSAASDQTEISPLRRALEQRFALHSNTGVQGAERQTDRIPGSR